jgi:hypothetical protein
MNVEPIAKPNLTEPGVKSILNYTLRQCHIIKLNYYNTLYNACLLFGFIFILGVILYFKYKGKPTKEEQEQKNRDKEQYILEKIKKFQDTTRLTHQQLIQQELITGLPHF